MPASLLLLLVSGWSMTVLHLQPVPHTDGKAKILHSVRNIMFP